MQMVNVVCGSWLLWAPRRRMHAQPPANSAMDDHIVEISKWMRASNYRREFAVK